MRSIHLRFSSNAEAGSISSGIVSRHQSQSAIRYWMKRTIGMPSLLFFRQCLKRVGDALENHSDYAESQKYGQQRHGNAPKQFSPGYHALLADLGAGDGFVDLMNETLNQVPTVALSNGAPTVLFGQ